MNNGLFLFMISDLFEAPVHDLELFLGEFGRATECVQPLGFVPDHLHLNIVQVMVCKNEFIFSYY